VIFIFLKWYKADLTYFYIKVRHFKSFFLTLIFFLFYDEVLLFCAGLFVFGFGIKKLTPSKLWHGQSF